MSGEGTPPAGTPPAGTPPAGGDPWFKGADAETIGYLQTRGFDKLTPAEAALAASKAHREAEKFIGAPAAELIRIPKPTDEAAVKAMWQRLGASEDPKAYEFKAADGTDLPDAEFFRAEAARLLLPKDKAADLARAVSKRDADAKAAAEAEMQAKLIEEKAALAKNWGQNKDANLLVAKNAALKLGMTPEEVAALEKVIGYARVMETLRNIGTKIGEDAFITNNNPNGGTMSRDQAVARKAELMRDTAWRDKYLNGDAAANREMTALNTIIVG